MPKKDLILVPRLSDIKFDGSVLEKQLRTLQQDIDEKFVKLKITLKATIDGSQIQSQLKSIVDQAKATPTKLNIQPVANTANLQQATAAIKQQTQATKELAAAQKQTATNESSIASGTQAMAAQTQAIEAQTQAIEAQTQATQALTSAKRKLQEVSLVETFRSSADDYDSVGYEIFAEGQKVGSISVMEGLETYLERIDIDDGYQGKGLGSAAISQLFDKYDYLYAAPDNQDSQRLFERIGTGYRGGEGDYADQGYGVYEITSKVKEFAQAASLAAVEAEQLSDAIQKSSTNEPSTAIQNEIADTKELISSKEQLAQSLQNVLKEYRAIETIPSNGTNASQKAKDAYVKQYGSIDAQPASYDQDVNALKEKQAEILGRLIPLYRELKSVSSDGDDLGISKTAVDQLERLSGTFDRLQASKQQLTMDDTLVNTEGVAKAAADVEKLGQTVKQVAVDSEQLSFDSLVKQDSGLEQKTTDVEKLGDAAKKTALQLESITTTQFPGGEPFQRTIVERDKEAGKTVTTYQEINQETEQLEDTLVRIKSSEAERTKALEKQAAVLDKINAQKNKSLADIDTALGKGLENTSKPLKLEENIARANSEAEKLKMTIASVYDAAAKEGRGITDTEAGDVRVRINSYKELIGTMQYAERAANKLRTKTVSEIMGTESESLDVLLSKMTKGGVATQEFTKRVEELRASIDSVKTNEQFIGYSVDKNKLEAEVGAEIAKLQERNALVNEYKRLTLDIAARKAVIDKSTDSAQIERLTVVQTAEEEKLLSIKQQVNLSRAEAAQLEEAVSQQAIRSAAVEEKAALRVQAAKERAIKQEEVAQARQASNIKAVSDGIIVLNSRIEKAKNTWSAMLSDQELMGKVSNIQNGLKQLKPDDITGLRTYQKQWQTVSNEIAIAGKNTKSFGDRVKETFARLSSYMVNVALIGGIGSALRGAINDLRDIDSELTNLSKVTNIVRDDFRELSIAAAEGAGEFGRKAQDYLQGQQIFAQAGKSNYEELGRLSLIAQSAGDMEAELASKFITAADAAYQLNGNVAELTTVVDGINNISNKSASSMTEIAEAVTRYASVASVAGESTASMASLINAGIASTQRGGDVIGNALVSLSSNIRSIKGELDGDVFNEESFGKAEKALADIGIRTRDIANGIVELKTPSAVLGELAAKFESGALSAEQLAYVLEQVGNKRQSNVLSAIVQNFSLYEDAMKNYAEGTGTAMREALRDAESFNGKLNTLSNSWTAFVAKAVDLDWARNGLTGLSALIDGIGDFISLPVVGNLAGMTAAMLAFGVAIKSVTATQMGGAFVQFFKDIGRPKISGFEGYCRTYHRGRIRSDC